MHRYPICHTEARICDCLVTLGVGTCPQAGNKKCASCPRRIRVQESI